MSEAVRSGRFAIRRRERALLGLLAATFLLRGIFLNLALPYGDPLDEPFHYGYAVYLDATGRPPRAAQPSMPAEALRPLRWLPRSAALPGSGLS